MGEVGILNVGAGDTKLTFDNKNPAETIRASRVVRDMLRRGYALLIEVDQPDGSKAFQRALDFDERTAEYIIADFDPAVRSYPAAPAEPKEASDEKTREPQSDDPEAAATEAPPQKRPRGRPTKRIAAGSTRAVAVARSAGG